MKNVKLILTLAVLVGTIISANAQKKTIRVYPKHGTVVTTVHKPRVIVHNRINYHFSDGVWYTQKGKRFVVAAAPVGVVVRRLPRGRIIVRRNGRKLYRYKGIWYQKHKRGFKVIQV